MAALLEFASQVPIDRKTVQEEKEKKKEVKEKENASSSGSLGRFYSSSLSFKSSALALLSCVFFSRSVIRTQLSLTQTWSEVKEKKRWAKSLLSLNWSLSKFPSGL